MEIVCFCQQLGFGLSILNHQFQSGFMNRLRRTVMTSTVQEHPISFQHHTPLAVCWPCESLCVWHTRDRWLKHGTESEWSVGSRQRHTKINMASTHLDPSRGASWTFRRTSFRGYGWLIVRGLPAGGCSSRGQQDRSYSSKMSSKSRRLNSNRGGE